MYPRLGYYNRCALYFNTSYRSASAVKERSMPSRIFFFLLFLLLFRGRSCEAFTGEWPKLDVDADSTDITNTFKGLILQSNINLSACRLGRLQGAIIAFYVKQAWCVFNMRPRKPWLTLCKSLFGLDGRRVGQYVAVDQLICKFPRLITCGVSIGKLYENRSLFKAEQMTQSDLGFFTCCPSEFGPLLPNRQANCLYNRYFM